MNKTGSDRVEVSSLGLLYGGRNIETAKQGKSRCRNSAIVEALHYMHIIEAWEPEFLEL